jgi:hypothetical protein
MGEWSEIRLYLLFFESYVLLKQNLMTKIHEMYNRNLSDVSYAGSSDTSRSCSEMCDILQERRHILDVKKGKTILVTAR